MTVTPPFLTGVPEANQLLENDLLALFIGMLLDQQIPMEKAFLGPWVLSQRMQEDLDARRIASLDDVEIVELFSEKPAIHRFPKAMAERTRELCRILADDYDSNPASLWDDGAPASVVIKRIEALPGFGKMKAKIFLALLAKRFGVTPEGWIEVTAPFGEPGSYMSVADIDSPEAMSKVREFKAAMKLEAKASKSSE